MLCVIRFKEENLAVLLMRQLTGSAGLPSRLSIGGNDQDQNLSTRQVENARKGKSGSIIIVSQS